MGKLHELLAVEGDLRAKAEAALSEIKAKFVANGVFIGQNRTYKPLVDGGEPMPDESKRLPSTVDFELQVLSDAMAAFMDASLQKEATNLIATTDLVLDSCQLKLEGFSATMLLNLEGKLTQLRAVLQAIPTNDEAEDWTWDPQRLAYVAKERITYRTAKTQRPLVLYPATTEHPAQVQMVVQDERVGEWKTIVISGMMEPARKRAIIARNDYLLAEVKKARQRANDIEIVKGSNMSKILLDFILG